MNDIAKHILTITRQRNFVADRLASNEHPDFRARRMADEIAALTFVLELCEDAYPDEHAAAMRQMESK